MVCSFLQVCFILSTHFLKEGIPFDSFPFGNHSFEGFPFRVHVWLWSDGGVLFVVREA